MDFEEEEEFTNESGKGLLGGSSFFMDGWEQRPDGKMNQNPFAGGRLMMQTRQRNLSTTYEDMDDSEDDSNDPDYKELESKRLEYMGPTPGKSSPTGRTVIKRTYNEQPDAFEFKGSNACVHEAYIKSEDCPGKKLPEGFLDDVWYNGLPLTSYDMGHRIDAVTQWNTVFRLLGETEGKRQARIWMKDPDIYELQVRGENRRAGAKLGHTEQYLPPVGE